MYITDTTNNVRDIIESFDIKNDYEKMKVMMYIFEKVDNGQINNKNIANPNIGDNEDIEIFTFERIGLTHNTCDILLQFLAMVFREIYKANVHYIDSHVDGLDYNDEDKIKILLNENVYPRIFNNHFLVFDTLKINFNNDDSYIQLLNEIRQGKRRY